MGFKFNGKEYEYHRRAGERCVELPVAFDYVKTFKESSYYEVGFVLAHHLPRNGVRESTHLVIDKYEKRDNYPNLHNVDIVDFESSELYKACFCISTLEHIGWDESDFDPGKVLVALEKMRSICTDGFMFVTVPLGYNKFLDECIKDGSVFFDEMYYMKQTDVRVWEQVELGNVINSRYNEPFRAANGLLIGIDKL